MSKAIRTHSVPNTIRRRTRKVSAKPLLMQVPSYLQDVQADIDGLTASPREFRMRLCAWIRANLAPASKTYRGTSYGLKHRFSSDCRAYVTNNVFKAALLIEGYLPINPNELNWRYRLKVKEDSDRWPSGEFVACWPKDREAANG